MPINYDDIVQYNLSDPPGGTPPTRKWQVNPAKVLQIRTATGSAANSSKSDWVNVTSIQMKRTKPDSIFYAQIAGRVSSSRSASLAFPAYSSYSYTASFPTTNTITITDNGVTTTTTYISNPNAAAFNTYAIWETVNNVATGSRLIYWSGSVVYSDNSTNDFVFEEEFLGNDGYQYKIGVAKYSNYTTTTTYTKRYEVARRGSSIFGGEVSGIPELKIQMSRMDGSRSRTLGGTWSADDEFNLPTENTASASDELPRDETTFELSDFYQPSASDYPDESTVFIQFQVKNSYSASSVGNINVGQNCQYFNVAGLRVYEIDAGTSTFIMKPEDVVFENQGGAAAPTYSSTSDGDVFDNPYTLGYGIPNSWWINRNIMYSPGVRCLIPNHNVAGQWVAFGEGYMREDGEISFSPPQSGDGEAYDTAFSHMLTYQGEMAGMITSDNGLTWQEMDGDMPNTSSDEYNPPIVFDWATNGDTRVDSLGDFRYTVWLVGGYERHRKDTDLDASYDGSQDTDGYDICIYRNDEGSFRGKFDEWALFFVTREDRSDNDENKIPQYISAICFSSNTSGNGYFVVGNNWGSTNRLSNSSAKTRYQSRFRNNWKGWYEHVSANQNLGAVNCLTSNYDYSTNPTGSKIVAGYNTKMLYSDDGGVSWDETYGYNNNDPTQDVVNWDTAFGGSSYQIKAIYNVTYIKDEVYVGNVKKGPGVWVACGFKSPTTTSLNSTKVPFYLYSENGEHWIEIDVQNDTNLPHAYPYNIRERITYTGNGTLMTWAGAGPGPSGPKSNSSAGSGSTYNKQTDSYKLGSGLVYNIVGDSVPGVRDPYGNPDSADNQWDTSKASFWVSHGSLTDWVQVSSGTPFIGGSYSGTANAPTDVADVLTLPASAMGGSGADILITVTSVNSSGAIQTFSHDGVIDADRPDGFYLNISVTGGSGSGATFSVVQSGSLFAVNNISSGSGYSVGSSGPGNTSAPNVFQMKADGWSHGRYMVASVGDEVYNKAGGRIAFIDIPE